MSPFRAARSSSLTAASLSPALPFDARLSAVRSADFWARFRIAAARDFRMAGGEPIPVDRVATPAQILETRRHIAELYIDERVVDYIVEIVHATRNPDQAGLAELKPLIEFGASPRATLALAQGSRAHAFLRGRAFVTPDDVKAIAPDVLRHRVLRTYEAEAEEVTSDEIVARILEAIPVP